jgi:predicted aspartyl protease
VGGNWLALLFLWLPLLLLAACGDPDYDCHLTEVAHMPMEVRDRLLIVPAGINGKLVHLVVDTGAERTTISDGAAERLGLAHDQRFTTRSLGVGGISIATDVKVNSFVLGETRFPIDRIAFAPFSVSDGHGLLADGLLGADILLAFDLDIDIPGHTLTLYRRRICPRPAPPWPEGANEITGVQIRRDRLQLPVVLDGASGTAILDTGAQASVVGPSFAARLGLTDHALSEDPTVHQRGVGPETTVARLHRFKLLQIGPIATTGPSMAVLHRDAGIGDMLIGEDMLQGHRIWLSFRPPEVFVSKPPP